MAEQTSSLMRVLLWLPQKLTALNAKAEKIAGKVPETIVLCLYCVLKAVMGIFHEPWFDEAVAWQIAREATFKDILLTVPHYEGHPPLWHLVLAPFAKLGAPYELSLVLVSLVFMALAMFLILWYAPFPRLVKWVLPFTYFCFYQYAVISRPYCMMVLAFVLCALAFEKHNEKPGRYVLSLAFLCLTSAFGIAVAGGLALAWVWEILREKPLSETLKGLFRDRRVWWLLALLALALLLILEIVPAEDTYAIKMKEASSQSSPVAGFIYLILCLPTDVLVASVGGYGILFSSYIDFLKLVFPCFVGLIIWLLLGILAKQKGLLLTLVLPYVCFAALGAMAYINSHHGGIVLLYFVFFLWVALNSPDKTAPSSIAFGVKQFAAVFMALSLCISLYWCVASCMVDVKKQYASSRTMASFIKEYHLDEYRVMTGWKYEGDLMDINLTDSAELMPYFDHNIFFNFMGGDDHQNYITHRFATEEETQKAFAAWRQEGAPDVLMYNPSTGLVYGDDVQLKDYAVVFHTVGGKIWKGGEMMDSTSILVRRELLPALGLKEMTLDEILAIDQN